MRINKTVSNIVGNTFAYAGRALVIGALGLGLSLSGCDDDEEPIGGNMDGGSDTAPGTDTNPGTDTMMGDTAPQGDASTDAVTGDTASGDALLADVLPL